MKTRKPMWEMLRAYHKKCGGYATVVILSELLWCNAWVTMAVQTSNGTECGRVRVPRTMHTYRLKHARGPFTVVPSRLYMTRVYTILTPRNTANVVNRFNSSFATLYNLYRAKTRSNSTYGRCVNGGANV